MLFLQSIDSEGCGPLHVHRSQRPAAPFHRHNKCKQRVPTRPWQFMQWHIKPLAQQLGVDPTLITLQTGMENFLILTSKRLEMKGDLFAGTDLYS
jgi:hypothetical protein